MCAFCSFFHCLGLFFCIGFYPVFTVWGRVFFVFFKKKFRFFFCFFIFLPRFSSGFLCFSFSSSLYLVFFFNDGAGVRSRFPSASSSASSASIHLESARVMTTGRGGCYRLDGVEWERPAPCRGMVDSPMAVVTVLHPTCLLAPIRPDRVLVVVTFKGSSIKFVIETLIHIWSESSCYGLCWLGLATTNCNVTLLKAASTI